MSSSNCKTTENMKTGWPSDSVDDLLQNANEQLEAFQKLNFSHIYTKCEEELECWHAAAVAHLGQIYSQRLADLAQVYTQDVCPESDKFKQKMNEQLKNRVLPRITQVLDEPSPDPNKVERMQNLLFHIKSECETMINRQWIRIQLPDIKSLSIPIKISKIPVKSDLVDHEKELFAGLSDDENDELNEEMETKKKRKKISIDPIDLFLLNPSPMKTYSLESNSSTLSLSNSNLLVHDNQKLIFFDYQKKLNEFQWNDNEYGILVDICWVSSIATFLILTIHSVYLYDPLKVSSSYLPIKIELIQPLERTQVFASICPIDRDIYINYHKGVHIDQYRVSSTFQWTLQKRHSKLNCCETKDIGIRDVRSDGQYLCLSIMQQQDLKWRLDLMSKDFTRIRRGIPMDSGENQHKFFSMLNPVYDQRWIFINWFTNKLWLVDQQGKTRLIKETKIKNIRNTAISPNRSFIAIRTEKPSSLKLYKLD